MKSTYFAMAGMVAMALFAGTRFSAETQPAGTIQVTGDALVKVVPDEIIFTLGVETTNKDLSLAKEENDQRVQRVVALARSHGVDPKDIQTEFISIIPEYQSRYAAPERIVGYRVGRTMVVTLREIGKFDALYTDVLELGANVVHGVDFRTSQLRRYRDQARALAIKAAEEKAIALAGELGQEIGPPASIVEHASYWLSSYGRWWGSYWGNPTSQNVVVNTEPEGYTTEGGFAPGQISIRASVGVTFALK